MMMFLLVVVSPHGTNGGCNGYIAPSLGYYGAAVAPYTKAQTQ